MDDDDTRHGKPTVHKAFDQATAVLAGDALHALAFEILTDRATSNDPFSSAEMVETLARASGLTGMAGGDRKSVAAGKGEAGSVGAGGRRSIKQKKPTTH